MIGLANRPTSETAPATAALISSARRPQRTRRNAWIAKPDAARHHGRITPAVISEAVLISPSVSPWSARSGFCRCSSSNSASGEASMTSTVTPSAATTIPQKTQVSTQAHTTAGGRASRGAGERVPYGVGQATGSVCVGGCSTDGATGSAT